MVLAFLASKIRRRVRDLGFKEPFKWFNMSSVNSAVQGSRRMMGARV